MTSSWFFLSTLNYDARSTTHQIYKNEVAATVFSKALPQHSFLLSRTTRREEISELRRSFGFVEHFTQSRTSCFLLLLPVSFCKFLASSQTNGAHSWLAAWTNLFYRFPKDILPRCLFDRNPTFCSNIASASFPVELNLQSKSKSVPLQAWSCPECSRKLRFPDFMTTVQESGNVVSLTHRQPLPTGNTPGIHFC